MTLTEFKAWFEGFTEGFDKPPTEKQWKRIKARIAEIDGNPVTERVFIDRYWPSHPRPYWWQHVWFSTNEPTYTYTVNNSSAGLSVPNAVFAMHEAGRAEALSIS